MAAANRKGRNRPAGWRELARARAACAVAHAHARYQRAGPHREIRVEGATPGGGLRARSLLRRGFTLAVAVMGLTFLVCAGRPPRTLVSLALPAYGRSNECAGGYNGNTRRMRSRRRPGWPTVLQARCL